MLEAPAPSTDWLVRTKLRPPALRDDVVARDGLIGRLRAAVRAHRLTLVSAPAGYGKTTLLSSLVRAGDAPIAWLSVDEEDDDPARFFGGLAAALAELAPDDAAPTPGDAADPRRAAGLLVNWALEHVPGEAVVVLDDLHAVHDPAVYAGLDYLVERLPPHVHLVVAGRHDPPMALARLRARRQLAELRLADLRFSADEATLYLNERLGLALGDAEIAALDARAEGWAAGLTLLAGSLGRIDATADRAAFLRRLAGTERHAFDFLAEEVLAVQEPAVREFLLRTSILAELTPGPCQAVTGRADAADQLDDLYRRALFLTAVEESGETAFRYHHLFADFLRAQLLRRVGADEVRALHRRAAECDPDSPRAVRHLIAAEAWAEAADAVERASPSLLRQGQLATLRGWIEVLPDELVEARPRLRHALGLCAFHRREVAAAAGHFEAARQGFAAVGDRAGEGAALAQLAQTTFFTGDPAAGLALSEAALARPLSTPERIVLLCLRTRLYLFGDHGEAADAELAGAFALAGADVAARTTLLSNHDAGFYALPGALDRVERLCQETEPRARPGTPLRFALDQQWAMIHAFRGRPRSAIAATRAALALGEELGGLLPWQFWILRTLLLSTETSVGAREPLDSVVDQLLGPGGLGGRAVVGFVYVFGNAAWRRGQMALARRLAALLPPSAVDLTVLAEVRRLALAGKLALADGDAAGAVKLLREAAHVEARSRMVNFFGSARAALAVALLAAGRTDEALDQADLAIEESERSGMPGRIVAECPPVVPLLRLVVHRGGRHADLAARLLEAIEVPVVEPAAPTRLVVPDTGEALSAREIEVLALIAAGASNRDVAEKLVVAERTVKSHVTSILAKLNVTSRTQAAARARDLGIG